MTIKKIGLKRGTVQLCPYNQEWLSIFDLEKNNLLKIFNKDVVDISHIGSTAIIGMSAKPIIDIMLGVDNLSLIKKYSKLLKQRGYHFRPNTGVPNRIFFAKGPEENRTHYLHIVVHNSVNWHNAIQFRDYLNQSESSKNEYASLKKSLAKKYINDRASYTSAKHDFILSIIKKARINMTLQDQKY